MTNKIIGYILDIILHNIIYINIIMHTNEVDIFCTLYWYYIAHKLSDLYETIESELTTKNIPKV
jgi:hypothetical protein